jgi:hypothetical protein
LKAVAWSNTYFNKMSKDIMLQTLVTKEINRRYNSGEL